MQTRFFGTMHQDRQRKIRELFDEYIEMYAARDDRLTERFSQNFSGYAGSGKGLTHDRDEWIKITRQDFAQVPGRICIEMLDIALQDLNDDVVVVTAFFHIHLPNGGQLLSREVTRIVLVFRQEGSEGMIVHSGFPCCAKACKTARATPSIACRSATAPCRPWWPNAPSNCTKARPSTAC